MPAPSSFDYAIVRVVPRVERGEFINVGAILFCRTRRFLAARVELDVARLRALAPDVDLAEVERHLALFPLVAEGGESAGPIGKLPLAERFHWLVAPRSTIIQCSPVHAGLCVDPDEALEQLMQTMVHLSRPVVESRIGAKGMVSTVALVIVSALALIWAGYRFQTPYYPWVFFTGVILGLVHSWKVGTTWLTNHNDRSTWDRFLSLVYLTAPLTCGILLRWNSPRLVGVIALILALSFLLGAAMWRLCMNRSTE
jgi:hypothetical protein